LGSIDPVRSVQSGNWVPQLPPDSAGSSLEGERGGSSSFSGGGLCAVEGILLPGRRSLSLLGLTRIVTAQSFLPITFFELVAFTLLYTCHLIKKREIESCRGVSFHLLLASF
jgi:hypothetical protein